MSEHRGDGPMTDYAMTDLDRGALLALSLLRRSDEVHEGEEEWQTTASDIASAIRREGLPATIRLQMDAETDYFISEDESVEDIYGAFPKELVEVAAAAPHTKWRRSPDE